MQVLDHTITHQPMKKAHCPRCEGFLVIADYMDMLQGGYLWGTGQRCVNCGYLADPTILSNQEQNQMPAKTRRRTKRARSHLISA